MGGDDLALLGELEAAVDRARGLGEDRAVRRPAAATERAAAAVEQRERDAVPARVATSDSWARYSSQLAARKPLSLDESE